MFSCMSLTSQVQRNWTWQVQTLIKGWDSPLSLNEVSSSWDDMSDTNVNMSSIVPLSSLDFFFYVCVLNS